MDWTFTKPCRGLIWIIPVLVTASAAAENLFPIAIKNASLAEGLDRAGVPTGWSRYGRGQDGTIEAVPGSDGGKALLIADRNPEAEFGIVQVFPLKGGQTYQVRVRVRAVEGASTAGSYLQFRALPSNRFAQVGLAARSSKTFSEVAVRLTAPPDTTKAAIYLYCHREPTPKVTVADVRVQGGFPPPPPPPPAPVPPQYDRLKDLHRQIPLVQQGRPAASIVVPASGMYRAAAERIQRAIASRTGVTVPIVSAESAAAAIPLRENLIVLGNRSTNATLRALYDLYYCLVDLKYPGPEGYVLRSVHNPFGNGKSVVIVGGSDAAGVDVGAKALAARLAEKGPASNELSVGWLMETRLGRGLKPPTDIKDFETWEASKGYGSVGYFGWCSISKRMAMYYMTGDAASAREVVRLAFPDKQAIKDIEQIDGERIENKHDPLAGFYHYNAHMAILFWDLIEESPVFSDEERLKITNAFARQLNHRKGEGIYGLTEPPHHVGSRHGQWSAISLYCLGRYFNRDYPHPVWAQCLRAGALAFGSLHEHAWLAGESDNLFWYNTGIAPILAYMVLSGDRKPLENGVLPDLLRGQEILISGRVPDWALNSAALSFLNQAAYLTGDGRWITYRQRTGLDTDVFRLGQSFWPDETIKPAVPSDLPGKWSILRLPEPAWNARGSGLPHEQSFYFGGYRSAADDSGDFILLDGFNGASRNPYHTFDILELRLAGRTMLQGYHNQVITSADGMVEPSVAMDAALLHQAVVGQTATATGEVARAAWCNWRRTLAQRTGRYALVVDDLTFRTESENMKVTTTWQPVGARWDAKSDVLRWPPSAGQQQTVYELRACDVQDVQGNLSMTWNGAVKKGEHRKAFTLIAPAATSVSGATACLRLSDSAAALGLPQPALAVAGQYERTNGELAILASDHLSGHAITSAGIDRTIVTSDVPVDVDLDFAAGRLHVAADKPAMIKLALAEGSALCLDERPAQSRFQGGMHCVSVPAGRHVLTRGTSGGSAPASRLAPPQSLAGGLNRLLAEGRKQRADTRSASARPIKSSASQLSPTITARLDGPATSLINLPATAGARIAVAAGTTIHLYSEDGQSRGSRATDAKIRVLRWWEDPKLLLAGCVDEKVIAFDLQGRRKWVFTSEMDPAVYEAAKNYWFKSAPGHEGIHGLYTAAFDEGKSRCFVGSACTLEILDEAGKLVKRTPVFWGPPWKFLTVEGRNGGKNLLIAQWPNGSDQLSIVSSKTLAVAGQGYVAVPQGHTYVGGWACQNRTAIRYEDLDRDGKPEVTTAVNGTWNRVTVYSEDGRPLANAQFGPGTSNAPRAQIRDMDLADLDGDGKKEIVVGIAEGLVVALDHQCQMLWSSRLASPPLSLRAVGSKAAAGCRLVVGCDDGSIVILDSRGKLLGVGKVNGRPTQLEVLPTSAGLLAVFATDRGDLKGFLISGSE